MAEVHPEGVESKKENLKGGGAVDELLQNKVQLIIAASGLLFASVALIVLIILYSSETESSDRPLFTYMIWRHGDRAPSQPLKQFSIPKKVFPEGMGKLTKLGAEQTFQIGLKIKKRYFDRFIPTERIYIRSTNHSRTIASAKNVLRGIGREIYIEHNTPMSKDFEGNPLFPCAKVSSIVRESKKNKIFLQEDKYKHIYVLLKKKLNFTGYVYPVFDHLNCRMIHNMTIPKWAKNDSFIMELKQLCWAGLRTEFGVSPKNKFVQQVRGGGIFSGVVKNLEKQRDCYAAGSGTKCQYFYGLSAHDITIGALLSLFSSIPFMGKVPYADYGANIAFELWQQQSIFKLRVLYANAYNLDGIDVTKYVPGCSQASPLCDVDKFFKAVKPYILPDTLKACEKKKRESQIDNIYFDGDLIEYFKRWDEVLERERQAEEKKPSKRSYDEGINFDGNGENYAEQAKKLTKTHDKAFKRTVIDSERLY